MFQLSPQQRAFFDAFGFVRIPGLFRDEIDALAAAFDAVFAAHPPSMVISSDEDELQRTPRAATRTYRHIIAPEFVEKSPVLRELPNDPRVRAVVRGLLDGPHAYRASDGHLFHCDTSWHYDAYGTPLEQTTIKLAFYLDRLRADSGAIRVIPGTHDHASQFSRRLQETLYRAPAGIRELYGVDAEEIPSWTLDNDPGDVLAWSFRTFHASFHGREGRRSFFLAFSTV